MKGKIFNAQEVQAILNGSKVMFREVIKKPLKDFNHIKINQDGELSAYNKTKGWYEELKNIKCPYQVGQKIFCKERFFEDLTYRKFAGFEAKDDLLEINARHMKQEHSRLTLLIKEIRVERLADISEEDAIKEGMEKTGCLYLKCNTAKKYKWVATEISDFRKNWNATHKKPEEKFEANPWIWKVQYACNYWGFEVVK